METIFCSSTNDAKVKQIFRGEGYNPAICVLFDDGSFYSTYMCFRFLPNMLGRKIVSFIPQDSGRWGKKMSAQMSDGSIYDLDGVDRQWASANGYLISPSASWIVDPEDNIYHFDGSKVLRKRDGDSANTWASADNPDWDCLGKIDRSKIKKMVDTDYGGELGVAILMDDGTISIRTKEDSSGKTSRNFPVREWVDESWRYKDICAFDHAVYGITTEGQVVLYCGGVNFKINPIMWPIPKSNAIKFSYFDVDKRRPFGIITDTEEIYYTSRGDWGGLSLNLDDRKKNKSNLPIISYPNLISGKLEGDWLQLAALMITMGGYSDYAPPSLRRRSVVRVVKSLGQLGT